jgi:hypothetical protein
MLFAGLALYNCGSKASKLRFWLTSSDSLERQRKLWHEAQLYLIEALGVLAPRPALVNSHLPLFMSLTLYYFVAFTGGLCFLVILRKKRRAAMLPPGPPGDPLVGHLLRMPSTDSALIFHEWCKTYGVFFPSKQYPLRHTTFRRGDAPTDPRTNHDNPRFISSCRGFVG